MRRRWSVTARARRWQLTKDARHRALIGREALVRDISAVLFTWDLVGINYVDNADEYDPEAEAIALRLAEAQDAEDLVRIIYSVFLYFFDGDAGRLDEDYRGVARDIWDLWLRHRTKA